MYSWHKIEPSTFVLSNIKKEETIDYYSVLDVTPTTDKWIEDYLIEANDDLA